MGESDEVGVAGVVLAAAGLWVLWELLKAGAKGQNATINRCGNCNMVLKPYQSPCHNCGYTVTWK